MDRIEFGSRINNMFGPEVPEAKAILRFSHGKIRGNAMLEAQGFKKAANMNDIARRNANAALSLGSERFPIYKKVAEAVADIDVAVESQRLKEIYDYAQKVIGTGRVQSKKCGVFGDATVLKCRFSQAEMHIGSETGRRYGDGEAYLNVDAMNLPMDYRDETFWLTRPTATISRFEILGDLSRVLPAVAIYLGLSAVYDYCVWCDANGHGLGLYFSAENAYSFANAWYDLKERKLRLSPEDEEKLMRMHHTTVALEWNQKVGTLLPEIIQRGLHHLPVDLSGFVA